MTTNQSTACLPALPVAPGVAGLKLILPPHDKPVMAFAGNSLTATRAGVQVDRWKRID